MERTRNIFWVIISITLVIIGYAYIKSHYIIKPLSSPTPAPPVYRTVTPLATPTQLIMPTVAPTDVSTLEPTSIPTPTKSPPQHPITILLDDFRPQPYPGETIYPFNRLGGERGAINNSVLYWGEGHATVAIAAGESWGGLSFSLNHPFYEGESINFAAVLPPAIVPAYQSRITGITAVISEATPGKRFRLELKSKGDLEWSQEFELDGGRQVIRAELDALGDINEFLWVLDGATAGEYVTIENVTFSATTPITDTAVAAFVWSYGMLLNNWDPATGLVRDKAHDSSGTFDAIQATGSLAAATAMAEQLGIIEHNTAVQIVTRIGETLLNDLPRYHGLWPHWVTVSEAGDLSIVPGTEWSSVDTAIAAIGLLTAQEGLDLDTSGTEWMIQSIDWHDLLMPGGIGHGYGFDGDRLPYAWDVFGGESWLVDLAYAGTVGQVPPLAYLDPPTANGSGFIDEMAWLFVSPPAETDFWGNDWQAYRETTVHKQTSYYPTYNPTSCFVRPGLFGLSAAEAPDPATAASMYQAYGVGGRFADAVDGSATGTAVIIPHYAALAASLNPSAAIMMWNWLIENGYFTPLNNVESLTFPTNTGCDPATATWNHLKGSWNLALQTLGWGRYLAERAGQTPILWEAAWTNTLLSRGTQLLNQSTSPVTTVLSSPPTVQIFERECENPDVSTVGQLLERADASGKLVHGQFGTTTDFPWPEQPGQVSYHNIDLPEIEHLYLQLRYSKASPSTAPILIYIDDEPTPRAWLYPTDQFGWDTFASIKPVLLGSVTAGPHTIKFVTDGQPYGVADLDKFILLVP
jgi:hypothetical protein